MTYYKNGQLSTNPTIQNVINPTKETILENGWYIYIDLPPSYNPDEFKIEKTDVVIDGIEATQNYDIIALTTEEIRERTVPHSISTLQGKLQLLKMGLLDIVETTIVQTGKAESIYWEYETIWQRSSPMINKFATIIKMSQIDLDNFFILASKLK